MCFVWFVEVCIRDRGQVDFDILGCSFLVEVYQKGNLKLNLFSVNIYCVKDFFVKYFVCVFDKLLRRVLIEVWVDDVFVMFIEYFC